MSRPPRYIRRLRLRRHAMDALALALFTGIVFAAAAIIIAVLT